MPQKIKDGVEIFLSSNSTSISFTLSGEAEGYFLQELQKNQRYTFLLASRFYQFTEAPLGISFRGVKKIFDRWKD